MITFTNAAAAFHEHFAAPATHAAFAPGRVNLIGEHTDYNQGFVLPMAIEVGITLVARPREDRRIHFVAKGLPGELEISADDPLTKGEPAWSNYVRGVLAGFQRLGWALPACDVLALSDLPIGGGLSSSAALEVATATLIETLLGKTLDPVAKAMLCQQAEHEFAGVPCGVMDQFAVTFGQDGHFLLLDCRDHSRSLVPMLSAEVSLLIINTMVKHALTDGGYERRRNECFAAAAMLGKSSLRELSPAQVIAARESLPEVNFRRARHVTSENERTLHAAEALRNGDWSRLGTLMYASHDSLRDDFEVSCPELDAVVSCAAELGTAQGIYGCRMTGGGFGGCAIALVATSHLKAASDALADCYQAKTGISTRPLASRPARGAFGQCFG